MAEELEQGTNNNTGSAESGTPQEQNTNDGGTCCINTGAN